MILFRREQRAALSAAAEAQRTAAEALQQAHVARVNVAVNNPFAVPVDSSSDDDDDDAILCPSGRLPG